MNKTKGIILIIMSALGFALMSVFVRYSGAIPSIQKSFFRNLIAFIVSLFFVARTPGKVNLTRRSWPSLILRSVAGTAGIIANFYAVDHLLIADASMLNKLSPFFVLIFSFLLLKEKLTSFQVIVVCGAFLGSLLVIKPSFQGIDSGMIAGLLGGLCAGFAYTMVRKLGLLEVKATFIVMFFSGFSCLVTLPFVIFNYTPMSYIQIGSLLLAGLAATLGQFCITLAYKYAPAREISVYDYSSIIFSALFGYLVFNQVSDLLSWIGYLVIILMAVMMFLYNKGYLGKYNGIK
ncbi:MAG: DMT family transporter [Erysipelotrichaceae bacterium]|nr:DMT family transporter [Erysipelotrichaceae bacterium]